MTTSVALHPDEIHVLGRDEGSHLHVLGQLAMIQVRRKRGKSLFGKTIAEGFYRLIQTPPGVENQHAVAVAVSGQGEESFRFRVWH